MNKTKVIIALPGNQFSDVFLSCWTKLVVDLIGANYMINVIQGYSSFVSFARMKTLGLDVLRGKDQKPFDNADYDVFLTIDSDMVYNTRDVIQVIEDALKYKVASGLYMMQGGREFATVKDWDVDFFMKTGSFQFLTPEFIQKWKDENPGHNMMKVAYSGMGMFACTKEVLNSIEYPYFWHPLLVYQDKDGKVYQDQCSEDVAFCRNIQAKGFDIYVNTDIRVGHEKKIII